MVLTLDNEAFGGLYAVEKAWFELNSEGDACDVLVRTEDGTVFTGLFATVEYIQRQMEITYQMTSTFSDTTPVFCAILDTPHIIVSHLSVDVIEDTIDNLMAMDVFESHFTRVTEHNDETREGQGNNSHKIA